MSASLERQRECSMSAKRGAISRRRRDFAPSQHSHPLNGAREGTGTDSPDVGSGGVTAKSPLS